MIEKYKIIKTFNSGNQAETFLAQEIETNKKVVIKKVSLTKAKNWKTIELFERECSILKNLNHNAIPSYLDSFHDEKGETENLYLVQDYIDGLNLQEVISSKRRFELSDIFNIIKQLLEILNYLHGLNPPLIHRDIKPSNIILTEENNEMKIHLIDFGTVNKSVIGNVGGSTIVGTIGYMASEQFMGKASIQSDLYSVGAVLLFLLTATEPSELPIEDMQIQFKEHSAIRQLNNESLNYFIEHLIDSSESKRYENSKAVLDDLRFLIKGFDIPKNLDNVKNFSSVEIVKNLPQKKVKKKWESILYISSLLIGIALASYIYLINFNSFSETELITITPYWVLPTAFGTFALTTEKENKLATALIRSAITTGLLIFFIHFIFPSL